MKKNKFIVEGIHCGSCVSKIENTLVPIEGVISVQVNLETGEVITELEDEISPMLMKSNIEDLGFRVNGFSKI